jgi:hypothetical protein
MHDELFKKPAIVARYRAGPYLEARESTPEHWYADPDRSAVALMGKRSPRR